MPCSITRSLMNAVCLLAVTIPVTAMAQDAIVTREGDERSSRIATFLDQYIEGVQKADCEAELRRRLGKGPPVFLEDKHALPVPEGDTHICQVWFQSDGVERSAKLKGAKEGEERLALWDTLKMVQGAALAVAKAENDVADAADGTGSDAAGGQE